MAGRDHAAAAKTEYDRILADINRHIHIEQAAAEAKPSGGWTFDLV